MPGLEPGIATDHRVSPGDDGFVFRERGQR
jgi:hypothetical protein